MSNSTTGIRPPLAASVRKMSRCIGENGGGITDGRITQPPSDPVRENPYSDAMLSNQSQDVLHCRGLLRVCGWLEIANVAGEVHHR